VKTLYSGEGFTEGPTPTPDGLVWVSVSRGDVRRDGRVLAHLGGGPNGTALGPDGWVYVTQNGGVDFAANGLPVDAPYDPRPPGVFRVSPDGAVVEEVVGPDGLSAPNDLVFLDGLLYFTDSGNGTVRDGSGAVIADGWRYPNGIAVDPAGRLWVADTRRKQVIDLGNGRAVDMPGPGPDGIRFDDVGRLYAACTVDAAVHVFEDSDWVGSYRGDKGMLFTNLCLDGGRVIVTAALPGSVLAFTLGEELAPPIS
jgi:gluconolactonase